VSFPLFVLIGQLTSLDQLLAMVPQPVKAAVLLFPLTAAARDTRREEDEAVKPGAAKPEVFWMKQTASLCPQFGISSRFADDQGQIPNACGTMGVLHSLANVCQSSFLQSQVLITESRLMSLSRRTAHSINSSKSA
jgi:hypothetical protein